MNPLVATCEHCREVYAVPKDSVVVMFADVVAPHGVTPVSTDYTTTPDAPDLIARLDTHVLDAIELTTQTLNVRVIRAHLKIPEVRYWKCHKCGVVQKYPPIKWWQFWR